MKLAEGPVLPCASALSGVAFDLDLFTTTQVRLSVRIAEKMDSWEPELFDSGPYNDDVLFDSFFDTLDEPRRAPGHQRNQSAALTMQQPLYGHSHFDTEPQRDVTVASVTLSSTPKPPVPAAPVAANSPKVTKDDPKQTSKDVEKDSKDQKQPKDSKAADPKKEITLPSGRRRISKEQTKILEESFQRNTHLDKQERERVCRETGLMVKNVNIWFQNRRQKAKTQLAQQDKSDIVGFFANRDDKKGGGRKRAESAAAATASARAPPISTPHTPYRGTPALQKRHSAGFQGSPTHDLGMQKPLMASAINENGGGGGGGYFGLGVSNFDPPHSPQQYSPGSTLGEFSPAQPFPQYMTTPKQVWESPMDQNFAFPTTPGRQSPPRMGRRSLMQSPQLVAKASVSSPQIYKTQHSSSQAAISAALSRSKSAAEIAPVVSVKYDAQYPELKRRRSNFGRASTIAGATPSLAVSGASTNAATSTQVSPRSSPPAHAHTTPTAMNTPFDAIGAANAQRMMATRTRSHTQPSLRYDSGVRLHLDDSNHQAVLVMVDQNQNQSQQHQLQHQQPAAAATTRRPTTLNRSTSARSQTSLSSMGIHIPPPQEHATVSPYQYMLENSPVLYDQSSWQASFEDDTPIEASESTDDVQFFNFPSFDS